MPDDVRLRALMVDYQSGDLAAFDQLYALIAPRIRGFLRRHVTDGDQVSDLAQDVFLQLHRARHTYNPAHPLMPWVMAIARHVWLMHRRSTTRRPQATADLDDARLAGRAAADAYADKADVHAALLTITPNRRWPVVWHHVWGLNFREIAARLRIREDAAKLRSSRGMAELRSRLSGRR